MLWGALNGCHPTTALCRRGEYRNLWRLVMEDLWSGAEIYFKAYVYLLTMALSFKYLMREISASDNDWLLVISNLCNSRKKWSWISYITG